MDFKGLIFVAACAVQLLTCGAAQTAEIQMPNSSFKAQTANIEEVVATEEDSYRAIAYVVRWRAARVLVTDPLATTHLGVGDSVRFIASHHDIAGKRLLSFVFAGAQACDCDDKLRKPTVPTTSSSAAGSETGLVEEVLRAEEDGYRFVGYIVQSHGERFAISDPLAQSQNAVGDEISFLAIRTNVTGSRVISFMASPAGLGDPTQAKQPSAALTSVENGVIDEVLSTKVDGYNYTAYIVESFGARIVVPESAGASPHRTGDQIFFESRRISNPRTPDHGFLDFAPKTDEARSISDNKSGGMHVSTTNDTATVDDVLTTQINGYRYVAYIAKWNGARVAISDVFATTHYVVGDRITFSVSRAESAGGRQLSFPLFNFERPSPSPQGNALKSKEGAT